MNTLNSCPYCGRKAKEALTSNWFPVYTCLDDDTKYCERMVPLALNAALLITETLIRFMHKPSSIRSISGFILFA